jgi:hypothetical protein
MRAQARRLVTLCTLVAVGATAASADAVATKTITLKLGDEFVVKDTHIVCTAQISRTLVRGRRLIGCAFADSKGPVVKTYAVGLSVNGEAVLAKVKPDGTPQVVTRRKPAVARREAATQPRLYRLAPGDSVLVNDSALACAINKQTIAKRSTIVISCFLFDVAKRKARSNSYGFGITDGGAFLVHFDKNSVPTIVTSKKHGA